VACPAGLEPATPSLDRTLTATQTQHRVRIDLYRSAGCVYWVQAGLSPGSLKALSCTTA
jgi:hypothetical protein